MVNYNIEIEGRIIQVPSEEDEMSVKRLKNHILRHFEQINYDNLVVFLRENNSIFGLDDNELVDCSQNFILEIEN
jgi:hypothetical protein